MSLKINVYTPGSIDKSYQDLIADYQKRLSRYCHFNWIFTKTGDKKTENISLVNALKDVSYLVLDEHGKNVETKYIARTLETAMHSGNPTISLVIGGSYGLSDDILKNAKDRWAFGNITLPHQLVRLIAVEQIYRVITILNNHPYHHE